VTVLTIGHSTRSAEEFLSLLQTHGVTALVDVRRFPASRRYPHFSGPALQKMLAAHGLGYVHEPDLGGHRDPLPDSLNAGWRIAAFRGYADHMQTAGFQAALQRVIDLARNGRPVVMCAEADPSRCHRQLLADALLARGLEVAHILGPEPPTPHALTPTAAQTPDGRVLYPAAARQRQGQLFRGEG
jgi:uncharacterized protein (DUF488 family)